MMCSSNHRMTLISLCVLFYLFLFFFSSMEAVEDLVKITPLMNQTCQKTLYMDLCIQTLSMSKKAATADLKGLAAVSVEVATKKAIKTASDIAIMLQSNKNPPPTLQQCISDCSENYEDVVDQLNDVMAELDKLPKGGQAVENDAVTWLSAAMSDISTCEEGCNMQSVNGSILTKKNTENQQLCSIALAIVKLVVPP